MPFRILGEPWKTLGGPFGGILGSGPRGQVGVEFLFRDDFITAEAAPLTSPRTAEPGPGIGDIQDTANFLDIIAGRMITSNINATGDPGYANSVMLVRNAGQALFGKVSASIRCYFGWNIIQFGLYSRSGFFLDNTNLRVFDGGTTLIGLAGFTNGSVYELFVIQRNNGAFNMIRGNEYDNWTLVWIGIADATINEYAGWMPRVAGFDIATLDNFRVSQLPSPWDTDYGIATDRLAGARAAGNTFVHEADCLIEFEATVLPGVANLQVTLREQDINNNWRVQIEVNGSMTLFEIAGGVPTARIAVGAATLVGGERIVVIADGNVYRLYYNNTLAGTYVDPGSFLITETSGRIPLIGAGGSISDIVSWPRFISGIARRALDRIANA